MGSIDKSISLTCILCAITFRQFLSFLSNCPDLNSILRHSSNIRDKNEYNKCSSGKYSRITKNDDNPIFTFNYSPIFKIVPTSIKIPCLFLAQFDAVLAFFENRWARFVIKSRTLDNGCKLPYVLRRQYRP